MLAKVMSFALSGIDGYPIEIETDINNGLPNFEMVGLPDSAVKESRERVRSAIKNSGYHYPATKITVNLAPADVKKEGAVYDLGIALGMLAATEQLDYRKLGADTVVMGELALNGDVRPVRGILPVIISALQNGLKRIIIPKANCPEASYVGGLDIFAVENLREAVDFLSGRIEIKKVTHKNIFENINSTGYSSDFKYVMGQYSAKRALEIAATGGHNILMLGPPGAGKTMLARCMPSILPDMTAEEALECTKIHSVAGMLDSEGIIGKRPFRSPHHTASRIALAGGSAKATPGEISLAHNGVLFLDELPEYPRAALEILRQPLEDGTIVISRAARVVEYPASFVLIASMNPCPCGNFGSQTQICTCSPSVVHKYLSKLSGPLMDRIDIHIEVDSVKYDDLRSTNLAEPSAAIRERVNRARHIQTKRFKDGGAHCNSQMNSAEVNEYCRLSKECEDLLRVSFQKLNLSARAHNRILKVARTIADLAGSSDITTTHLAEAIQYRSFDRKYRV